jgi:hypothetical protein
MADGVLDGLASMSSYSTSDNNGANQINRVLSPFARGIDLRDNRTRPRERARSAHTHYCRSIVRQYGTPLAHTATDAHKSLESCIFPPSHCVNMK